LPGKVYARVLERRIRPIVDPRIQEEQCEVFVPVVEHWTSSIPSTGLLEGLWEFAQPVHMCFVVLEKAFDSVPRGILWGCSVMQMMLSCYGFIKPGPSACTGAVCSRVKRLGCESAPPNLEAMVLDWKRVACPLRVGGEVLPQVEGSSSISRGLVHE
ncbi:hypothetical protein L3Q82_008524, partial [Scortum barcoo]